MCLVVACSVALACAVCGWWVPVRLPWLVLLLSRRRPKGGKVWQRPKAADDPRVERGLSLTPLPSPPLRSSPLPCPALSFPGAEGHGEAGPAGLCRQPGGRIAPAANYRLPVGRQPEGRRAADEAPTAAPNFNLIVQGNVRNAAGFVSFNGLTTASCNILTHNSTGAPTDITAA